MSETFQMKDRKGVAHTYKVVSLLRASVSLPLALRYQAVLSSKLLNFLAGDGMDGDAKEIGALAAQAFGQLADKPELIHGLFANVTRDGKLLEDEPMFDEAYSGNWDELYMAIPKLLLLNGIIPFSDTISELLTKTTSGVDIQGALRGLLDGQPSQPAPTS
jgi:hypothetical protein